MQVGVVDPEEEEVFDVGQSDGVVLSLVDHSNVETSVAARISKQFKRFSHFREIVFVDGVRFNAWR